AQRPAVPRAALGCLACARAVGAEPVIPRVGRAQRLEFLVERTARFPQLWNRRGPLESAAFAVHPVEHGGQLAAQPLDTSALVLDVDTGVAQRHPLLE